MRITLLLIYLATSKAAKFGLFTHFPSINLLQCSQSNNSLLYYIFVKYLLCMVYLSYISCIIYKHLIQTIKYLPKLCEPIIIETISELLQNSLWKIFSNVFLYKPLENCLPALFYIIICGYTAELIFTPIKRQPLLYDFQLQQKSTKQSSICQRISDKNPFL